MNNIKKWLKDNKKKIACISDIDKNDIQYNHEFYLVDENACNNVAYMVAEDLELRKMEDIAIEFFTVEEARFYGFMHLDNCINFRG